VFGTRYQKVETDKESYLPPRHAHATTTSLAIVIIVRRMRRRCAPYFADADADGADGADGADVVISSSLPI